MAASSSSSAKSSQRPLWKYDVYLSFNREDTWEMFTSHLYEGLRKKRIATFQNDRWLEHGIYIRKKFLNGIEESRIAVIIFSQNYASSSWCLDEVAKIMECRCRYGQIVIPVFYDVDQSTVLRQITGTAKAIFEDDFLPIPDSALLIDYFREMPKVQIWTTSLTEAASLSGYNIGVGIESDFIGRIVDDILSRLEISYFKIFGETTVSSSEKHLVGIGSRVKKVQSLLNVGLGGVYFVGIWGTGGSGKTTVARAIFDKISGQFEGSCFLENVRGTLKKHGLRGLEHLQMKLLSQILKQDSLNIESADEGVKMISGTLSCKKVLIVLDDVDNDDQLEYIVGKRVWFGNGSRIITTTRNADLLRKHDELYCVPELDTDEALELFSWHAFRQETPDKAFENLSICVVIYANGLPLTLEVLGSFLYKKGMNEWRSALDKLKDIRDRKVIKQLSLSLDGLSLKEKDIFLCIACFLRGKKINDVRTILNSLGLKLEIESYILITKSLLYISEGMVEMHDLIEQMGQQVVRDSDQDKPWMHSSLWNDKDIGTVHFENLIPSTHTFPIASNKELMQRWKYDVFLSFRGEDTRNNFVAHLYKQMEDVGIHAFKDDVKLERGKFISPELLKAIEESKFAVIIFSENYASSTWCLEELTKIMECVEKKGLEAIPIFYNVDPSDVRHQRNSFAKEMAKHMVNLKGNGPEMVQRWKDALHKAANIAGWMFVKLPTGE